MAKVDRRRYNFEALHSDETTKFFTYMLIMFNILYAFLGAMMLAAAFYVALDEDFRGYVKTVGLNHYMVGIYIILIAGTLVMVESFFGICGAYLKKSGMLTAFIFMVAISFLLEIIGASYLLANGIRGSKIEIWLQVRFYELIAAYNADITSRRTMDIIQEWIGCCGANGVADYIKWNIVVPNTCFDPITGNAWYRDGYGFVGCVRGFTSYVEKGTSWVCSIALLLAFFQIFGMICALFLRSIKKDFLKKSMMNLNAR